MAGLESWNGDDNGQTSKQAGPVEAVGRADTAAGRRVPPKQSGGCRSAALAFAAVWLQFDIEVGGCSNAAGELGSSRAAPYYRTWCIYVARSFEYALRSMTSFPLVKPKIVYNCCLQLYTKSTLSVGCSTPVVGLSTTIGSSVVPVAIGTERH
eukprot:SAG31_NODE_8626_length_1417_cov_2.427921_2_plen_153_part_00